MTAAVIDRPVALVTGAGRGIGRTIARRLCEDGFRVAAFDIIHEPDPLPGVVAFEVDVTDLGQVRHAVAEVEATLGPIDVLVNNAGVLEVGAALEIDEAAWQRTISVNVNGVFHTSQTVAARMAERGRGSIVTVASNAGLVPRVRMAAYCASKAASAMFTKALGLELAQFGVRCNVVAPGSTDTPMQRQLWDDEASGRARAIHGNPAEFRVGVPLGRMGEADDIAEAVAFLSSDRARHITMHQLVIDGGASLGH